MKILIGSSFLGNMNRYLIFSERVKSDSFDFGILVGNLYDFSTTDMSNLISSNTTTECLYTYRNNENEVINYTKDQIFKIGGKTARSLAIDVISEEFIFKLGISFIDKFNKITSTLLNLNVPIFIMIDPIIFDIQKLPKNIISIYNSIYIYKGNAIYGLKGENKIDFDLIKSQIECVKNSIKSLFIVIYEVRKYVYDEDGEVESFYYPHEIISSKLLGYCLSINLNCRIFRIAEGKKYETFNFDKKYEGSLKNGVLVKLCYDI